MEWYFEVGWLLGVWGWVATGDGVVGRLVGCYRRLVDGWIDVWWLSRVLTRFRMLIRPTAGGLRWGFLLSLPMPEAWRAVAGAVAGATTPIRAVGGSLLHGPLATWLAVWSGTWSGGLLIACGTQDSTGVLWEAGWGCQEFLDCMDERDGRDDIGCAGASRVPGLSSRGSRRRFWRTRGSPNGIARPKACFP